jgi:hypothetical protein
LTTHWIRSLPVMGWRASLLLDEAEASSGTSGPVVDASVPGINCCAMTAEANKRIEQLTLQIISAPPMRELIASRIPLRGRAALARKD